MPIEMHNNLNIYFNEIFGWNVRNGLFCFGVTENYGDLTDLGYGTTYFFFPIGKFRYVYDSKIFDLYFYLNEFNGDIKNDFINSINYVDTGLFSIIPNTGEDGRSVEIMMECSDYYLVNTKYSEELVELIW